MVLAVIVIAAGPGMGVPAPKRVGASSKTVKVSPSRKRIYLKANVDQVLVREEGHFVAYRQGRTDSTKEFQAIYKAEKNTFKGDNHMNKSSLKKNCPGSYLYIQATARSARVSHAKLFLLTSGASKVIIMGVKGDNNMHYDHIISGTFLKRPNRFLAIVLIGGQEEEVHVKNTGRCRELLIPRVRIYMQQHNDPKRKTKYSLIGVKKGNLMINMDSQAPNKAVGEWLRQGGIFPYIEEIKAEKTYGNSRFDFFIRGGNLMEEVKEAFVEVKGVTLEEDGTAWFPDAPTERGVKHIEELIHCMEEGYEAYIVFVIQMKGVHCFRPNDRTHRAFGDTLRKAAAAGVHVLAVDCLISEDTMEIDEKVPVML